MQSNTAMLDMCTAYHVTAFETESGAKACRRDLFGDLELGRLALGSGSGCLLSYAWVNPYHHVRLFGPWAVPPLAWKLLALLEQQQSCLA